MENAMEMNLVPAVRRIVQSQLAEQQLIVAPLELLHRPMLQNVQPPPWPAIVKNKAMASGFFFVDFLGT